MIKRLVGAGWLPKRRATYDAHPRRSSNCWRWPVGVVLKSDELFFLNSSSGALRFAGIDLVWTIHSDPREA